MAKNRFLEVPAFLKDANEHRRRLAITANHAIGGKLNCTGDVTFTASAASTTVTDARVSVDSVVLLMPTTSNAGFALADESNPVYIAITQNGQFTIYHANNSQTDRTFAYAIIG